MQMQFLMGGKMVELSDHTRLMNIMIGLSMNIPHWPHSFKDLKYNVELIEPKITEANPDLIITNKKFNHSMVVDCKSQTLEEKQIKKYVNIRENPNILIQNGFVQVPHHNIFKADPTISTFYDLSSEKLILENKIPLLHVIQNNNHILKIEKKCANFQNKQLDRIFPIDTSSGEPPYNLYPFDENDEDIFSIAILRQLVAFGTRDKIFTVEGLLQEVHPFWSIIHNKKKFKEKATTLLIELQNKGKKIGLNRYIYREGIGWRINISRDIKSIRAFQKICSTLEETITYKTVQKTINDD